jgi:hypothetical protein
VRNVAEKAAGWTAAGAANGSTLASGKICGQIAYCDTSLLLANTCVDNFNIDAIFAADIIPRGWEVRQAWQSRLSVPDTKVQSFGLAAA